MKSFVAPQALIARATVIFSIHVCELSLRDPLFAFFQPTEKNRFVGERAIRIRRQASRNRGR